MSLKKMVIDFILFIPRNIIGLYRLAYWEKED